MQYIGQCSNVLFLPVASNDNDDLLSLSAPFNELLLIRAIKRAMREDNAETGVLLSSSKERRFFQEVTDAERYILLRYFTYNASEKLIKQLKRHIMNTYLFPKRRKKRSRKSPS